jgi:hypothetical protein
LTASGAFRKLPFAACEERILVLAVAQVPAVARPPGLQ